MKAGDKIQVINKGPWQGYTGIVIEIPFLRMVKVDLDDSRCGFLYFFERELKVIS